MSARLLVVEDNQDVRRMIATALALEGYEVHEAATAREGLERLQGARYNLVLSDYAMPGGTGTWMLQEARRQGLMHGTAAVILTAHPGAGELAGLNVIRKPLELDLFLAQVRQLLGARPAHDIGTASNPSSM